MRLLIFSNDANESFFSVTKKKCNHQRTNSTDIAVVHEICSRIKMCMYTVDHWNVGPGATHVPNG